MHIAWKYVGNIPDKQPNSCYSAFVAAIVGDALPDSTWSCSIVCSPNPARGAKECKGDAFDSETRLCQVLEVMTSITSALGAVILGHSFQRTRLAECFKASRRCVANFGPNTNYGVEPDSVHAAWMTIVGPFDRAIVPDLLLVPPQARGGLEVEPWMVDETYTGIYFNLTDKRAGRIVIIVVMSTSSLDAPCPADGIYCTPHLRLAKFPLQKLRKSRRFSSHELFSDCFGVLAGRGGAQNQQLRQLCIYAQ